MICVMLLLVAARLVWLGSVPLILARLLLLPAFATAGQGLVPYLFDTLFYGFPPFFAGGLALPRSLGEWQDRPAEQAMLYVPVRNTLLSVILLFALYLVFEFHTLWFRTFPQGFYDAEYAHQGAAWLTLALALATFMLSAILRGRLLRDPRIGSLKRLARGWSAANFVLAIAVYNRLFIYIVFNGMTRMRVVGLLGMSTVVVGFLLVVVKIHRRHRFLWLIQRHLWTLALALYLLVITPVDYLVHSYNVRRIHARRLAPSVRITEHHVDASGWYVLQSLVDCEDEIIRSGVRAKLAEISFRYESRSHRDAERGEWSRFQLADRQLHSALAATPELWQSDADQAKQKELWPRFRTYAYQWY